MGVDLYLKTKKANNDKNEIFINRGFGELFQNCLYGDNPIIPKIKKELNISFDFLFEPNLYEFELDENEIRFNYPEDMIEDALKKLDQTKIEAEKAWVKILPFKEKLEKINGVIKSNPNYYSKINYNRVYWENYLDNGDFLNDIAEIISILEKEISDGFESMTFVIE